MRTKITICLFLILLLGFFTVGVVVPKDEQSGIEENRTLKEMPDITLDNVLSGKFSVEFEEYLSDNVGFRSKFTSLSARINGYKGIKTNLGRIVTVKKDLGAGGESDDSSKLLVLDDRIMEMYSHNEISAKRYADAVNKYGETFSGKAKVYSMLIPTQIEFAKPIYAKSSDNQKYAIDSIYNEIDDGVVKINAYDALKEHKDEYVYFRTDHHWTQRGAYCGYSAFMNASGRTPVPLESLTRNNAEGFLGFLYNQANEKSLSDKPDTIEFFAGEENYDFVAYANEGGNIVTYPGKIYSYSEGVPKYSLFMGGDHSLAVVDTNVKDGGTVLVIKDSYANALIPLLTNNYSKILVVDPRSYYGTVEELVEQYRVDDILIMNYIFTTTFDDFIDKIDSICR